jgi:hypothetical protein
MKARVRAGLEWGDVYWLKASPHEKTGSFCGEIYVSPLAYFLREVEGLLAQAPRSAKLPPLEN